MNKLLLSCDGKAELSAAVMPFFSHMILQKSFNYVNVVKHFLILWLKTVVLCNIFVANIFMILFFMNF